MTAASQIENLTFTEGIFTAITNFETKMVSLYYFFLNKIR